MPDKQTIAWNGISLNAPVDWEPTILERDFMRLEQEGLPAAELKWRRVRGSFSPHRHVRKLDRKFRAVDVREAAPGQPWEAAAEALRSSGFGVTLMQWESTVGAVLHNPATGLAALIQVPGSSEHGPSVLASFRDHWNGRSMPWCLFGIRARLPVDFLLDTFSFKPGHYTIRLRRPKRVPPLDARPQDLGRGAGSDLVLERFAPADVMLKERILPEWVKENYRKVIVGKESIENDVLSWWHGQRLFMRRTCWHQGRAWRDHGANAVFAVYAKGTLAVPEDEFKRICESYGAV